MKTRKKIITITAILALTISVLLACKTPVYKYAIMNWSQRDIYHVFRAYDSSKNQEEMPEDIKGLSADKNFYANYGIIPVDINSDLNKEFGEGFKEFLTEKIKGQELPTYSIVNPMQNTIYTGKLTTDELKTLGSSPKTIEIANKLCKGEIVFIFIPPTDKEVAVEKRKVIDSALKQFIEIEKSIQLESGELPPETQLKDVKAVKASYVEVSSEDPKEKFLYATLKGINPNFKDDGKEKLMGIVGRGFTFDSVLTGETFDEEQIISYGIFLSGPCSCTVKSGNPGTDIITNWDWDEKINISEEGTIAEEPMPLEGFGGEEIESVEDTTAEAKPAETEVAKDLEPADKPNPAAATLQTEANTSPTGEQIADGDELTKIILFSFIGLGVVLLVITKLMKTNAPK